MTSSLSSVVSNLVRASMGTSVSSSVTDEDLDRHVKELLVKEAKKREEKYGQQGIRAYLASSVADSNAPKTNKRFLTSIIRSTDDHNKTILRAQAEAAQEIKRERAEVERRDRRARAEEAVAAERERMKRVSGRRMRDSYSWDHWDGRRDDRKRKKRCWETYTGEDSDDDEEEYRHRRRHRSRSRERDGDRHRKSRSRRSRSPSPRRHSSRRHHRSRSRDHAKDKEKDDRQSRRDSSKRKRRSPTPSVSSQTHDEDTQPKRRRTHSPSSRTPTKDTSQSKSSSSSLSGTNVEQSHPRSPTAPPPPPAEAPPPLPTLSAPKPPSRKRSPSPTSPMDMSRSPSPGPSPVTQLPSKMDKYFEESYDPRLDVAPLTVPTVPKTGLINNAEYEGWDAMLELLKQRSQDKEDKKRLEKMGYNKEEIRQSLLTGSIVGSSKAVQDRWNSGGISVLDIEYKKRGALREWDMGKETPT